MKILYFIPSFQHPDVRGPNRHYHFIRELSQRHDITLLALKRSEISQQAMDEMASYTRQINLFDVNGESELHGVAAALSRLPAIGRRLGDHLRLRQALQEMRGAFQSFLAAENFDVVLFHGKSVFPVIADWQDLPIVIDFCDATSMRYRAKMPYAGVHRLPLLGIRYAQIRRLERRMVQKTSEMAFISTRDREAIMGGQDQSAIIPNGLDLKFWRRTPGPRKANSIVFTGVMDYAPNEDAAIHLIDHILPLLQKDLPDIEMTIVGRNPTQALLDRGARHPEVKITGFVEDVRPYLAQASVFAAPVRFASGMQNKVQEAFAMEVPVVTSSIVAAGLPDKGKDTLLVADGDQEFANEIITLLNNPAQQERLASAGRRYAETHFDWSRSALMLEAMCTTALAAHEAQPIEGPQKTEDLQ